jgi:hypothetical protein
METVNRADIDTRRGLVEKDSLYSLGELVAAGAFPDHGLRLEFLWVFLGKVFLGQGVLSRREAKSLDAHRLSRRA